jgi:hypothetical protein
VSCHSTSSSSISNGPTQVKLIGTLLLGTTLAWFALLLEHQSPLLNNFEAFKK